MCITSYETFILMQDETSSTTFMAVQIVFPAMNIYSA